MQIPIHNIQFTYIVYYSKKMHYNYIESSLIIAIKQSSIMDSVWLTCIMIKALNNPVVAEMSPLYSLKLDIKCINSICVVVITFISIISAIVFRWMAQDTTNDKSTLVQVMACAIRQKAITWANVDTDLCCYDYVVSLDHSEINQTHLVWQLSL